MAAGGGMAARGAGGAGAAGGGGAAGAVGLVHHRLGAGGLASLACSTCSARRRRCGLALIRTAARYGERMLGHDATLRAVAGLRGAVLAGLATLPWPQMQRLRRGPATARIVADTDALDGLPLRVVAAGPAAVWRRFLGRSR